MKRFFLICLLACASLWSVAQSTSLTAVQVNNVNVWDNTLPVYANHCLNAVTGQSANACPGAMSDVSWFKFSIPTVVSGNTVYSSSVKITVVPTGFDAIVEFFTGTAAAPVYRQCANAGASGVTEVLKTDPNAPTNNPLTPGTEYYVRVSSATDVASGCFQIGIQYYLGAYVIWTPNPNPETGMPGYKVNEPTKRWVPVHPVTGDNLNNLVQGTRFRFIDTDLPTTNPGCTIEVGAVVSLSTDLYNASCITYGNSYNVAVQMRMDNHWCGETWIRVINMEAYPSTTISPPSGTGSCPVVNMATQVSAGFIAPTAIFQWEWCTPGSPCTTFTQVPGISFCQVSSVPCIKFNKVYTVRVRVQYPAGTWGEWSSPICVTTAQIPYTSITSGVCGGTAPNNQVLICQNIVGANSYAWRFIPINPGNPLLPIGPATMVITQGGTPNAISLTSLGLVPGTTYRVQAAARNTTCGFIQEGNYGAFCIITMAGGAGMALEEEEEWVNNIERIEMIEVTPEELAEPLELSVATVNDGGFDIAINGYPPVTPVVVRVYSLQGQILHEESVDMLQQAPVVSIQLDNDLPQGLYVISVDSSTDRWTEKVFLQ